MGKTYEGAIFFDIEAAKAAYLPTPVEGVDVLVIVVATDPVFRVHIDAYVRLLKATYGENNVKVQGCGVERVYRGYSGGLQEGRQEVEGLWYATRDFLSEEEFGTLLNISAFAGENYDQIHVIGHGDPNKGLLFRKGVRVGTDVSTKGAFDESKAGSISEGFQWPIKPGADVVLAGCDTHKGGLKGFIENVPGVGRVHPVVGDFKCAEKKLTVKLVVGKTYQEDTYEIALDWYDKEQEGCIYGIAEALGINKARGIRPARKLARVEEY
jgi:hypothetical protein